MSSRKNFDITSISASDLPDNGIENSKKQVYAEVSVGKCKKKKTQACSETNPMWNFSLSFSIKESEVKKEVAIKLYRKRCCFKKDEYIGEVNKSLGQLLKEWEQYETEENNSKKAMGELPLKKGPVTSTGTLRFSYRFKDIPVQKRTWWQKILIGVCTDVIVSAICCGFGCGGDSFCCCF